MTKSDAGSTRSAILVVEDHRETRSFLELALTDDYTVDFATDADEALAAADEADYQLFLIDIGLRDSLDGTELAARLRCDLGYATTPMVAMTAHQPRKGRQYYLEHGFHDFMAKPFYPDTLLERVRHLLADHSPDCHHPRN